MQREKKRNLSETRRTLRSLHEELGRLLDVMLAGAPLFRGYVYETARRCGKPTCGCATDDSKRHRGWFVISGTGGKRTTRLARPGELAGLKAMADEYRRFRRARSRFRKLAREAQALLDAVEELRTATPRPGESKQ
jgi:hypothetical protein